MRLKEIKVGGWYETSVGFGMCVRSGGTRPPSVQLKITKPFQNVTLTPLDVIREASDDAMNGGGPELLSQTDLFEIRDDVNLTRQTLKRLRLEGPGHGETHDLLTEAIDLLFDAGVRLGMYKPKQEDG